MANKTKRSANNLIFGTALKLLQVLFPFAVRTVMIYYLGIEYVGLNSLFTSILQVLNITELGVSTAMVFHMVVPMEQGDTIKVCALMKMYKIYYRVIGAVILVIGIAITPFLPYLIESDLPEGINLYVLYYLNLGATVASYWLFAYKNSLFNANQRRDVVSKATIVTDTIKYTLQIIVLVCFRNYYLYLIIMLFTQLLNNIIIALLATKKYPNYRPEGELSKEDKKKVNGTIKDLFTSKIGLVVTTSVDTIVISAFLGLITLGIYQNYYYIISSISAIFSIFYHSCSASITVNLAEKTKEANFVDFRREQFMVNALMCFAVTCLISLTQPFIVLWVGEDLMLDYSCVILFCIYLFVINYSNLTAQYKDSAGDWHKDRFRPLVCALLNLTLNIIMVQFIGVYGILLSTIIAYIVVDIPWILYRTFKDIFMPSDIKRYLWNSFKYIFLIAISSVLAYFVNTYIVLSNAYLEWVVKLVVCTCISIVVFVLPNIRSQECKATFNIIKRFFRKKESK